MTACAMFGDKNVRPLEGITFSSVFENASTQQEKALNDAGFIANDYWWRRYDDPALEQMIAKLVTQNMELEAAAARMVQAQEQIAVQRASYWPSVNVEAGSSRRAAPTSTTYESSGIDQSGFGGSGTNTIYSTNYNLGLSASWQLDLFGQISSATSVAKANYLASEASQRALAQSLIAQLVGQRVRIANLSAQIWLIEQTRDNRDKMLKILERRYKLGVDSVSALDIRQARANLASAKADLSPLLTDYKNAQYAMDVLLGQMPGVAHDIDYATFPLMEPPERLALPPPIALLDRRPDLQTARYRIYAAEENINVAVADLYPSFSISGGYGYQSPELDNLISAENIAWNLASNLMAPLFEGGRLRANVRIREAEAREMVADYQQNILTAVQEVENALAEENGLREQYAHLLTRLEETKSSYMLARERYLEGVLNVTSWLDIEQQYFNVRREILNTQLALWQARLDLILALGGTWYDDGANTYTTANESVADE